ncbi:XP_029639225.1uncharacterized protein LOC115214241 [Octopus vulgaris]|uniref:XP_029639225.1uncharacterized protein LOC115214241 n=1 Tax=Octopus vulgaris TaxID=6645 RepID=A0AA36B1W3_OCTVU|nr:XP_029639225.1uncharacterized protein LOC115214241 [Octopus vulgaris]
MTYCRRKRIADKVMDEDEIKEESCTLLELATQTMDIDSAIEWMAKRRLLSNSVNCGTCGEPCTLITLTKKLDKKIWNCRRHNFTQSIRKGSFFERSRMSLLDLLLLINMWVEDYQQKEMMEQLHVNKNTIVDWCNFLREVVEWDLQKSPTVLGGVGEDGTPIVVELGESKFLNSRYHKGQWRAGHWVFGAIERRSGKCCMVEVPNRKQQTLEPIIRQWILPGSRIIADAWVSFDLLKDIDFRLYSNDSVVHERDIVNQNDPNVHAQIIENTWMRAKRKLKKQCGTSDALFSSYLHEFLWKNKPFILTRIHTGEKLYHCDICDKTYVTNGS